jgi:hypothetical protein
MKRNPILIFGVLCMLLLNSCGKSGGENKQSLHGDGCDTVAIIKDFLLRNHFVDSSVIDQVPFNQMDSIVFEIPGASHLSAGIWMKGVGEGVPTNYAFEQINSYVRTVNSSEIRSFLVEKNVFEDYIKQQPTLTHFKLCIAHGRDGNGVNDKVKTLVVIGVGPDSNFLQIQDPKTHTGPFNHVYDQISPCPSECPTRKDPNHRRDVYCDYVGDPNLCEKI